MLGGIALAGALPLSLATDRDDPWFDYRTWAEGLATPSSVRFDWEHSYGPIRWQREGREMLRIQTRRAQYWKLENLEDFDGQRWVMRGVPDEFGPEPEADLEQSWTAKPQWSGRARVTVRGLRGDQYAGAGTTIEVDAAPRRGDPDLLARHLAGRPRAQGRRFLRGRVPRAAPERARAVGRQQRRARPAERRADDDACRSCSRCSPTPTTPAAAR